MAIIECNHAIDRTKLISLFPPQRYITVKTTRSLMYWRHRLFRATESTDLNCANKMAIAKAGKDSKALA